MQGRTVRSHSLASAAALTLAAPLAAQTSPPPAEPQIENRDPAIAQQVEAQAAADEDEIVVTGLRASIASAVAVKRDAINIVDSISAVDVGKLPDQNVVDTLSRIPGVQITRSRGDGASFTIRGITLNNTLINGRTFAGATSDSSARLDVLSADIIGSIDVIKSPSADMIEGALGGTVNLITKRPLDLPSGTIALRAQGQYGDLIDKIGYRGSALFSFRTDDKRFGVLISVASQRIWSDQQLFITEGYNRVNDVDGNGDGVNDPGLFRPARLQLSDLPRVTNRLTVNGALQFRPNADLELLIDGTYNKFTARGTPSRYQILLNSSDVGAVADADRTVVSGRFNGVTLRPLVYKEDDENDVYAIGGKAKWARDGWGLTLDASYGLGKAPFDAGTFTFVVLPRAGLTTDVTYDLTGSNVPSFAVTGNFDLSDPNQFRVASISDNSNTNRNTATAFRADGIRQFDGSVIRAVNLGYRYEDRSFYTARRVLSATLASIVAAADTNRDGIVTPNELPSVTYGRNQNFLPGLSGTFPRSFPVGGVDVDAARAQFGYTLPPISPTTISDVSQKSHAGYVRLDLDGGAIDVPVKGHLGVRYLKVDRTSAGNIDVGGIVRPVSFGKNYEEWLPSAALNFDVRDDLILRLAAARVVASPPLSDVSAGFTYNITSNTGVGGNPLLDPYKADQFDASLEFYPGRGNLIAASFFYKKVKSFTTLFITEETIPGFVNPNGTGNVFRITRPRNGSNGSVTGFEVNVQQSLDMLPGLLGGFGIQANYTYAKGKTPIVDELTQSTLPLSFLSKNSYSLIGYYEKGPVQARVAYTARDGYLLAVQTAPQGGSRYVGRQDQLDASLQLGLFDGIKLTFDGQNLLRKGLRQYDGVATRVSQITLDDRRFFFGVSAAF